MTRKEVIEGNKLIAEFMGYEEGFPHRIDKYGYVQVDKGYVIPSITNSQFHEQDSDTHQFSLSELKFYSSWDWIMPVVEKVVLTKISIPRISRMYFNTFRCRKNHPEEHNYKVRIHSDFDDVLIKTSSNVEIEAVWLAVVEFIKWYNSCKKK